MLAGVTFLSSSAMAQDWANWRGPEDNGISRETNLVDEWCLKGAKKVVLEKNEAGVIEQVLIDCEEDKNILWKSDTGGRSTPIVLNGQVYLNCRTKDNPALPDEKINIQEQVICWDAETGEEKWRDKFNVFQTDIPAPRVGWAAMCGDEETGNVFMHSVGGIFRCYAPDGSVVWEKSLAEQYGKISGYGGRTQTPFIDEDRVIVSYLATNWGDMKGPAPKHYYYAFDKKTGDLLWISGPGGAPKDTNYSAPAIGVINGQRMLIAGNADGGVYAINARTGQPIWSFKMSHRGLNTTPVIDGDMVYISHGEDNIDSPEFGRVQCIDATGTGDVTETHSVWKDYGVKAGYTALLAKDGIVYVVADIGNMIAFDGKTGEQLWTQDLGTVGKGSPIWADGKIYATEVNGNVLILKPSREKCEVVNHIRISAANGNGLDEIYSSPAIADGRLYIVTRDRTICIGDKSKKVEIGEPKPLPAEAEPDGKPALVQLRPYEVDLSPGESQAFEVVEFDANGRELKRMAAEDLKADASLADFKIEGATVTAPAGENKEFASTISTTVDGLEASARVRTYPDADTWSWDFEGYKGMQVPITWNRAFIKVKPFDLEGNMVMKVTGGPAAKGRPSHQISIGPDDMTNYEMQIDVRFEEQRRQLGALGLSVNRYNVLVDGNRSQLRAQSWPPHLRMAKSVKYRVDPDVWYTLKSKVDVTEDKAMVYGKVWKTGEEEPKEWTLEQTDPHPNMTGSPGIYIYAQADCYFDNVKVFRNPDKDN